MRSKPPGDQQRHDGTWGVAATLCTGASSRSTEIVYRMKRASEFYDSYWGQCRPRHPVEELKQSRRVEVIRDLVTSGRKRVLVVGCGQGAELRVAGDTPFGVDISLTPLRRAMEVAPRARLAVADATRLPYLGAAFDCILCSEVIEHIPEAATAVGEMARVLGPKGELVLTTSNWRSLFGLARLILEAVTGRPVTAGGQPVDRWTTLPLLRRLLEPWFAVHTQAGCWYFPPLGRGDRQLPF